MSTSISEAAWSSLSQEADTAGLNLRLVLPRERVEQGFRSKEEGAAEALTGATHTRVFPGGSPGAYHPSYECAVLLGTAGRRFWERFMALQGSARDKEPNPMDRYTERVVEELLEGLRGADATAVAAYPFEHPRRIMPFLALLEGNSQLQFTPFGVGVDTEFGPWFAWRAVLLTVLPLPLSTLTGTSPCAACPAPCVSACPAGVVAKERFDWQGCVSYRVHEQPCRSTCLARMACPVGTEYRYGGEQMAYHYNASLRMIEAGGWAKQPRADKSAVKPD
ncbi:MAG: hypothetical protein O7G32_10075 [SAR324 cluster bacterium]|nr:hypothetical protein [SAR324 cluster bacterium]